MQIKTLTYSRTVNIGNFNSEKFEACADLDETDDPNVAGKELKEFVMAVLASQINMKKR